MTQEEFTQAQIAGKVEAVATPEAPDTSLPSTVEELSMRMRDYIPLLESLRRSNSSGDATLSYSTSFEDTNRFLGAVGGSGSQSVTGYGLALNTGSTSDSHSRLHWALGDSLAIKLFSKSPRFSVAFIPAQVDTGAGAGEFFAGIGELTVAGTGITFTDEHIGFKVVKDSGVLTLYGTQSDGTENEVVLDTIAQDDVVEAYFEVRASVVTYHWRVNRGSWNSTPLSGNVPASDTKSMTFATSNVSTANNFDFYLIGATYQSN